ncbi:type IX secretion system outer membrane channel protein PorV [Arcticibacter tournemirensis]|nr:type IX secretion system outer membrane channel protein PorV [Arcticibacter tournemirensis]
MMIRKLFYALAALIALILLLSTGVLAQSGSVAREDAVVQAGVPFLLTGPDARSGGMGDVGAATTPDINAIHWNPSKLAFLRDSAGVSISYSPWLSQLISDMYLAYVNGYYRLDDRNVLGISLRYFSAGNLEQRVGPDDSPTVFNPNEFAIDGTFSRRFGEVFSLGTSIRFIRSNLSDGQITQGQYAKPGTAIAADVSGYYNKETVFFGKDGLLAFGAVISNIGNKISYTDGGSKLFLPTNLRLGAAATVFESRNEFTLAFDINKLLVPSPPERDAEGNILRGYNPDKSVPSAIFGSFTDAPGGFSEELKEIAFSLGGEYVYNKQIALRAGYFYENPDKGNRRYLTLGAGFRYGQFNLDFSYLPGSQQKSPLANTLRFSLAFNIKK